MLPLHAVSGSQRWHKFLSRATIRSRRAVYSWLQYQPHMQFLLRFYDLHRNLLRAYFPVHQPVVNNSPHFSNAGPLHHYQNSHYDTPITSHHIVQIVHEFDRDFRVCCPGFGSSVKYSRSTLYFLTDLLGLEFPPYTATIQLSIPAGLTPFAVINLTTRRYSSTVEFCNGNTMMSSHALPCLLNGTHNCMLFSCFMRRHRASAQPHRTL